MQEDKFLSQEELDALLQNLQQENVEQTTTQTSGEETQIDPMTIDMVAEIGNIALGSGATTLSTLLKRKVDITTPEAQVTKVSDLKSHFKGKYVFVIIEYTEGFHGSNFFLFPATISSVIADLMMGGTGETVKEEFDEISISAMAEAVNQMMGGAATALSEFIGEPINISPPEVTLIDFDDPSTVFPPPTRLSEDFVITVRFGLKIEGLEDSEIWQIVPLDFAEELKKKMLGSQGLSPQKGESQATAQQSMQQPQQPVVQQPIQQAPQQPIQQPIMQQPQPAMAQNMPNQPMQQYPYPPYPYPTYPYPYPPQPPVQETQQVNVQKYSFKSMYPEGSEKSVEDVDLSKLHLLLDVPLEITVELGRTRVPLRDILNLHQGSMLKLDKLAGEPVDIYVNGNLVARGEVVVIDENFGVRLTEIVSIEERLKALR